MSVCAGIALGTLAIFLTIKKVGGDYEIISPIPENTIIEQQIPTTTVSPKPRQTSNYGKASYYDRTYCEKYNPDCVTASGETFDDTAFTCACASWFRLGSVLKVSYKGNSIMVKCNDRGNFESKGRILDLSKASFEALAPLSKGVIEVEVEIAEQRTP